MHLWFARLRVDSRLPHQDLPRRANNQRTRLMAEGTKYRPSASLSKASGSQERPVALPRTLLAPVIAGPRAPMSTASRWVQAHSVTTARRLRTETSSAVATSQSRSRPCLCSDCRSRPRTRFSLRRLPRGTRLARRAPSIDDRSTQAHSRRRTR